MDSMEERKMHFDFTDSGDSAFKAHLEGEYRRGYRDGVIMAIQMLKEMDARPNERRAMTTFERLWEWATSGDLFKWMVRGQLPNASRSEQAPDAPVRRAAQHTAAEPPPEEK